MYRNEMDNSSMNLDNSVNVDNNKTLSRKHIAERQRRARINTYLEEIQTLISNNVNTKTTVKPEKAEVLEKAVIFLQSKAPTGRFLDTECYKQGFNNCMTVLLDRIPTEFQEKEDFKDLRSHLEKFLVNLTTEAETMERVATMATSPYIQSHSADWYQHQTGRGVMKTRNQSLTDVHSDANGTHYSAANNKTNFHSPNLLCSVQENPKWFSDWNTQMQMQYMESYQDQNAGHDISAYDVFQGIKNIYSNYLHDEEAYHVSIEDSKPCQNHIRVKQEACDPQTMHSQTSRATESTVSERTNSLRHRLVNNYDSKSISGNISNKSINEIAPPTIDSPAITSQSSPHQLWRPW